MSKRTALPLDRVEKLNERRSKLRKDRDDARKLADDAEVLGTETHVGALVVVQDEFTRTMSESQVQYHLKWAQAERDRAAEVEEITETHFEEIAASTGIHLTNIEAMYAASGVAITDSWEKAMTALGAQVDSFIADLPTQGDLPSIFTTPNERGEAFAQAYDAEGNYVGHQRGTHDINGVDPEGFRTGTRASSRADFGLGPVGSTPPGLPGLPSAAAAAAAVARQDRDERRNVSGGGAVGTGGTSGGGTGGAYHAGGIFRNPTRGIIAEAGPEVVIPLSQLTSVVRRATEGMGGGHNNGGGGVTVVVGEGAYVFDDFIDEVSTAVTTARLRGQIN